ncbi:MAG: DUF3987 domain-containing protein [Proteobacteria bacterium]|nr:DUF3987 domain-containing protein [Pseudomonadota bacterium]
MRDYITLIDPLQRVLDKLYNAKPVGDGWQACCPAHADNKPSLSVTAGDDGRVLLRCHAGCETQVICAAIGLTTADLFAQNGHAAKPKSNGKPSASFPSADAAIAVYERTLGTISAQWDYYSADGEHVGSVLRWNRPDGGKDIKPVALIGGGWHLKHMPSRRPLYGLPDLPDADEVIIVEGEKCADAARSIGLIATTSSGGANAADKSDWSPLSGKRCIIFPDADKSGEKYAASVADILHHLTPPAKVKIVTIPDLPPGGDISDWLDGHGDAAEPDDLRDQLQMMIGAADWLDPPDPLPAPITWEPFPVKSLPSKLRRFVIETAAALGCDPAFVVLPALAVLASCVGNSRRIRLKASWSEPCVIWSATIAPPSSLKSPAWQAACDPLQRIQQKIFAELKATMREHDILIQFHEKQSAEWKREKRTGGDPPKKPEPPVCLRLITSDATVEALVSILAENPRGCLYAVDELASWLNSMNSYKGGKGGDLQAYLSMHRAGPVTVDRKTGKRITSVPRAAVSICGTIQPGVYERLASSPEFRESGMMTRLLVARPPVGKKVWTDADVSDEMQESYSRLIGSLLSIPMAPAFDEDGTPEPILMGLTPAAKRLWINWYNHFAVETSEADDDLAGHFGKIEAYAARFALLFQLITDPNTDAVDGDAMGAAINVALWFAHEARRVTVATGETEEERQQRQLIELIERRGGEITARELARASRRYRESGSAEAALLDLYKAGVGEWKTTPSATNQKTGFRLTTGGDGDTFDNLSSKDTTVRL